MVCIVTFIEETTSGYGEMPVYFVPLLLRMDGRESILARRHLQRKSRRPAPARSEVNPVSPSSTLPQAPRRSRTVGCPQAAPDLALPAVAFPYSAPRKGCPTSTPALAGLLPPALQESPDPGAPGLAPPGLRRPSSARLVPRGYPWTPGLGRWRAAPAGRRTCPVCALRLCLGGLAPLPRGLPAGPGPVASLRTTAFPTCGTGQRSTTSRRAPRPVPRPAGEAAGLRSSSGPAAWLASQVAPPAVPDGTGPPWLFRPRLSQFCPSLSSGETRPSRQRVTDGSGTCTLQRCAALPAAPQRQASGAAGSAG